MARQMKDSGVEWIGRIPDNWSSRMLFQIFSEVKNKNEGLIETNLLSLSYGKIKRKDIDSSFGLLPESFEGYNIIEKDDIVLRLTDLQNDQRSLRTGLAGEKGIVTSAYTTLRRRTTEAAPSFMHYCLHAFDVCKGFYGMGAGVRQGLNWSGIRKLVIPWCSEPEQRRISVILDHKCAEIDKVVAQTRATIEEYKKLKQAIITEAVTKGVRGSRPMKPSGVEWIGDIPVGWYTSKAGRFIASTQNGLTRRDLSESSGDIVLKLRNITPDGTIDYSAVTRVKLSDAEKTAYTLEKGDFLFVRVNGSKSLVGKSAIFDGCDEDVAYNDHIIRVRLETNYSRAYFKWFLLSTPGKTEIDMRTSTSAGQFTISGQELRNIRLCVPSEEEQQEIATYLDIKCAEIDRIIEKKEQLIEELGSYKKSLIYEYVTGKKEVTA